MYSMDVMDDLFDMADSPTGMDLGDELEEFDEFEADDGFDEYDAYDDEFDQPEGFDEFDAYDDYDDFAGDDYGDVDFADAMEDLVADALGAEDMDEFFGRMMRGLRRFGGKALRVARQAAPVLGQVARGVGSIASLIPHPAAQAVGGVANVVGQLMADEADEFEAIDALADLADYGEDLDAAAPIIAGLTIRKTMPNVARLPKAKRRQVVRKVTQSTRRLIRQQGGKAAKAMPGIVHQAKKTSRRTGQPVTRAIARTAAQAAQRPTVTRKLARPVVMAAKRRPKASRRSRRGYLLPSRRYQLRGPVEIVIRGR